MNLLRIVIAVSLLACITENTLVEAVCPEDLFACDNGECIDQEYVCDTDYDCGDNTDEELKLCHPELVPMRECRVDEFNCTNGECVEERYVCDGVTHCSDDSDEDYVLCIECPENTFKCKNGNCVGETALCDKLNHCGDNSDEDPLICMAPGCRKSFFRCSRTGECVHKIYVCNGYGDCSDNTDEIPRICNSGKFECGQTHRYYQIANYTFPDLKTYTQLHSNDYFECRGSNEHPPEEEGRLADKYIAEYAEAMPWAAKLRIGNSHVCGAAILTEYILLTAAHCLNSSEFKGKTYNAYIRVGEYNFRVHDGTDEDFQIENIICHPEFNKAIYLDFDIALIRIKSKQGRGIQFNNYTLPICLPTAETPYDKGMMARIGVWEPQTQFIKRDDRHMRLTDIPVVSPKKCENYYGQMTPSMMCAGFDKRSGRTCQGDSGGPLVAIINGRATLLGISSYTAPTCDNAPSGFANVQYLLPWILNNMKAIC